MISISDAPQELIIKRNKHKTGIQTSMFVTFSIVSVILGFLFNIWDVAVYVIIGSGILFFGVMELWFLKWPREEKLIVRRNTVKDIKTITGFRTRLKNLWLILEPDEIPDGYTQTNEFSILNSISTGKLQPGITFDNAKDLVGKEVEIEYLATSGYIVALRVSPPFKL